MISVPQLSQISSTLRLTMPKETQEEAHLWLSPELLTLSSLNLSRPRAGLPYCSPGFSFSYKLAILAMHFFGPWLFSWSTCPFFCFPLSLPPPLFSLDPSRCLWPEETLWGGSEVQWFWRKPLAKNWHIEDKTGEHLSLKASQRTFGNTI